MKKLALIFSCLGVVAAAAPAAAHHSAAAFDSQKKTSVTGKVVEYRYMNPHIYLTLEVTKEDGTFDVPEALRPYLGGQARIGRQPPIGRVASA